MNSQEEAMYKSTHGGLVSINPNNYIPGSANTSGPSLYQLGLSKSDVPGYVAPEARDYSAVYNAIPDQAQFAGMIGNYRSSNDWANNLVAQMKADDAARNAVIDGNPMLWIANNINWRDPVLAQKQIQFLKDHTSNHGGAGGTGNFTYINGHVVYLGPSSSQEQAKVDAQYIYNQDKLPLNERDWDAILPSDPSKIIAGVTPDRYVRQSIAQEMLNQGFSSKWTGVSPSEGAYWMANSLANAGITQLSQFGKLPDGSLGNTATGKKISDSSTWGSISGAEFGVQFGPDGKPYFYTQSTQKDDGGLLGGLGGLAPVAAIGLAIFAPGIGTAIGTALGATGTAASVLGSAIVQGTLTEMSGGKFADGAIKGAISAGVAPTIANSIGSTVASAMADSGFKDIVTQSLTGAATNAATASVTGGNILDAASKGALAGAAGGLGRNVATALEYGTDVGSQQTQTLAATERGLNTVGDIGAKAGAAATSKDPSQALQNALISSALSEGKDIYNTTKGSSGGGGSLGDESDMPGLDPAQIDKWAQDPYSSVYLNLMPEETRNAVLERKNELEIDRLAQALIDTPESGRALAYMDPDKAAAIRARAAEIEAGGSLGKESDLPDTPTPTPTEEPAKSRPETSVTPAKPALDPAQVDKWARDPYNSVYLNYMPEETRNAVLARMHEISGGVTSGGDDISPTPAKPAIDPAEVERRAQAIANNPGAGSMMSSLSPEMRAAVEARLDEIAAERAAKPALDPAQVDKWARDPGNATYLNLMPEGTRNAVLARMDEIKQEEAGGSLGDESDLPPDGQGGSLGDESDLPPDGQGGSLGDESDLPPTDQGGSLGDESDLPPDGQGGSLGDESDLSPDGQGDEEEPQCAPGYTWNGSICVSDEDVNDDSTTCPDGYLFDLDTQTCVPIGTDAGGGGGGGGIKPTTPTTPTTPKTPTTPTTPKTPATPAGGTDLGSLLALMSLGQSSQAQPTEVPVVDTSGMVDIETLLANPLQTDYRKLASKPTMASGGSIDDLLALLNEKR